MSEDVEVTAAYRLGELNERERIIKLLWDYDFKPDDDWTNDIIALIKGENK
jgi:hypothetical protein